MPRSLYRRVFIAKLLSKDDVDVPHSVKNPDHLYPILNWQVENQITAGRKTSQAGHKFVPIRADERELSKRLATFLELVKERVGIIRTVLGYVQPDFIKVAFSLRTL
jgi:hypothetical protein